MIAASPDNVTVTPNATMTGLAAPSRGSSELSTWRVDMAAGITGPEHSVSREQVWTLTVGSLEVIWDGGARTEKVTEGQTLVLPPDVMRRIHSAEAFQAYVAMRADGVVTVPGEEGTRALPWAQ
ncbi:cupin [Streptomyces sp. NPDC059874]|uniref:cupin n=1 Tax=Streptomyces sp. NPDC059874 TaxID=3346983 RepID=UPI003665442B